MCRQPSEEAGILNVNGAKVSDIWSMLNLNILKWVMIAFNVTIPAAWYATHKWLENFAYKTELSWWIFALAGLLALGIALLTVSWSRALGRRRRRETLWRHSGMSDEIPMYFS